MNKLGSLVVIIVGVIFAYVILTASHSAIRDMVSSANTTMVASSNMTNYPGTQSTLLAMPWILYFIPAVIGIAVVVYVLKFKK